MDKNNKELESKYSEYYEILKPVFEGLIATAGTAVIELHKKHSRDCEVARNEHSLASAGFSAQVDYYAIQMAVSTLLRQVYVKIFSGSMFSSPECALSEFNELIEFAVADLQTNLQEEARCKHEILQCKGVMQ